MSINLQDTLIYKLCSFIDKAIKRKEYDVEELNDLLEENQK